VKMNQFGIVICVELQFPNQLQIGKVLFVPLSVGQNLLIK
jgi:hypothetical protein